MRLSVKSSRQRLSLTRFRYLILLITICGGGLLIFTFNSYPISFINNNKIFSSWANNHLNLPTEERFTIKTEGCIIPDFQPFDAAVQKFIYPPRSIKACPSSTTSLLDSNKTHITVIKENLWKYNIPDMYSFSCCYKPFYRPSSIVNIYAFDIDDRVTYEKCTNFTDFIEAMNEFVKVSCYRGEKLVFEQFYLFAINKPTSDQSSLEKLNNSSVYNVLILGIDAVSRLNFHRTMPKTLSYLKEKGSIELLGYNKVADNTFPNLTPMLMGLDERELRKTCWSNPKKSFDNCPFIWEWFKEAGYQTALGEDTATLGTFNLLKTGFIATPTDYYLHTFMNQAEVLSGNNKDYNMYLCMGNKYFFQVLLDYIEGLATALTSSRLFGFFWEVTMSHDYLNYPMAIDDSYESFLKTLDKLNYLSETIVIMISDHGIRWGEIRLTRQGYFEERLPLAHILLPPSFTKKYSIAYENLKQNTRHLTTPFDIHETLYDLVDLNNINNGKIFSRMIESYAKNRGISLFLPIPSNRTCESAGIDHHWCACHHGHKIEVESKEAQLAGAELVKYLNTELDPFPQCATLYLAHILQVTEMVTSTNVAEVDWREFLIVIRTTPGDGMFEATIRYRSSKVEWSMAGSVSRLNLYGKQSRCVQNPQIRLYCYCR